MYFYEFNKGYFSPDFARGSEDGVVELTRPTFSQRLATRDECFV